jgi:hypothetical protein
LLNQPPTFSTVSSLADARRHFDVLKSALANEQYYEQISWHEGQKGSIDALQMVILLMIYYPSFCKSADGEPSNAYGHKERCLDAFLNYSMNEPTELERWIALLPKMLSLFDELQLTFPDSYEGRFGKINEVQIYDVKRYEKGSTKYRKTPVRTLFLGNELSRRLDISAVRRIPFLGIAQRGGRQPMARRPY